MRGFLARAGHALGRLIVSLGYGGGQEPTSSPVVCFQTTPIVFEIETEAIAFLLGTEPTIFAFATDSMALFLETEPAPIAFETDPIVLTFTTEPVDCAIGIDPNASC